MPQIQVEVDGIKPIGHYGNGFKSGSMRLGKVTCLTSPIAFNAGLTYSWLYFNYQDALVFTKSTDTMSVGFLSQTYLFAINAVDVLVPIVTWDKEGNILLSCLQCFS